MKVANRLIAEAMAALEAIVMLQKTHLVPDGTVKPNQLFFYLLCFSVLLHGFIVMLPASFGDRALSDLKTPSIQARIRVQMVQTPTHGWSESAQTERRSADPLPREPSSVRTTVLGPTQRQPLKNNVAPLRESDTSPKSSFNMEDLREQARTLAKEPSDQFVRGANTNRYAPEKAVPEVIDRPILEALSKRLGKPLAVMSEQVMNDGSRFIRFSGNTCLHIPKFLPLGRESAFGQTILLTTNCP